MFLKVFYLLHDLIEDFGTILRRISVFYQADLDLQF